MCCNETLDQKHTPEKETFLAEPQQCIQHLTPSWEWYHQPFNAKTPATSYHTKNSEIPFKEILPFSAKIHKVNVEMTFPAAWKHPLPKANSFSWQLGQLFHDSCHSFSWQLGQLSHHNCHNFSWQLGQLSFLTIRTAFFRTAVTVDLVACTSLIFPHLVKIKTNYWKYISHAKISSFYVALSLIALTRNSKNTLKLNIPFLAKS